MGYNQAWGTWSQYNMFSVPFVGVDGNGWQLNGCVTGDLTAGTTADDGDFIDIWDPTTEGYETWYYRSLGSGNSWRNPEKRTEKFEDVHPEGLAVGTAFWYFAQGESAAITFLSPLKPATVGE